jgi:hypothetical protein
VRKYASFLAKTAKFRIFSGTDADEPRKKSEKKRKNRENFGLFFETILKKSIARGKKASYNLSTTGEKPKYG